MARCRYVTGIKLSQMTVATSVGLTFFQPVSYTRIFNGKSGPKDQVALLLYFAFALVHDSRGIEIVNFTISLPLSAGTLMASAGTPYRLVPAHFYPFAYLTYQCISVFTL